MSLIDEALKRARMEAAQKAAEGEGLPYPSIPRHLAPRRRSWLAPAVVAAAVLVGLLVGWAIATRGPGGEAAASRGAPAVAQPSSNPAIPGGPERDPRPDSAPSGRPEGSSPAGPAREGGPDAAGSEPAPPEPPPSETVSATPASPADPAPEPAPREPPPAALTEPARPPARETGQSPSAAAGPSTQPAETGPPAGSPATRPAARPEVEAPARGTSGAGPGETSASDPATDPAPPATTVTDADSGVFLVLPDRPSSSPTGAAGDSPAEPAVESHVQRLSLPGGGAIELGGIAWSETGPFALLNGRVVGPGARVEGYTLERIRPGHVELAGEGRRVHLSLQ